MEAQQENLPEYLRESWRIICKDGSDSAVSVACDRHPDCIDVIKLLGIYYRMGIGHSGEKRLRDSLAYHLDDIARLREESA